MTENELLAKQIYKLTVTVVYLAAVLDDDLKDRYKDSLGSYVNFHQKAITKILGDNND